MCHAIGCTVLLPRLSASPPCTPPPAAAPPHPPFDIPQCSGGGHSELGEASRGRINLPIPTGWLFNGRRGFTLSEKVFRRGVTVESF